MKPASNMRGPGTNFGKAMAGKPRAAGLKKGSSHSVKCGGVAGEHYGNKTTKKS